SGVWAPVVTTPDVRCSLLARRLSPARIAGSGGHCGPGRDSSRDGIAPSRATCQGYGAAAQQVKPAMPPGPHPWPSLPSGATVDRVARLRAGRARGVATTGVGASASAGASAGTSVTGASAEADGGAVAVGVAVAAAPASRRVERRRGRRPPLVAPAPEAGAFVAGACCGRAGCDGACAAVSAVSTAATALSASAATAASSVAGALSSVPAVTSSVVGFACAAPSPAARRDDRRRERVPDPEDSTDAVVVAAAPASGFPEPEGAGSDCVPEDSSCRPIARAAGCAVGAGPSFLGVCLGVSDWPLPPLPPLPPR